MVSQKDKLKKITETTQTIFDEEHCHIKYSPRTTKLFKSSMNKKSLHHVLLPFIS